MRRVVKRGVIAAAMLLASTAVFAHHGTGVSYDATKFVTLNGTVTKFTWRNPHAFVEFDVKNEQGEKVHWVGEMNSPTVLRGAGWSEKTIKEGDEITVTLNPARANTPNGVVSRARPILINGKQVLGTGDNNQN